MYKFYYAFLKQKCENVKLLLTDTDSLCFETEEDFYEIMHKFSELFDLSNFFKDSQHYCAVNKKYQEKLKMNMEEQQYMNL